MSQLDDSGDFPILRVNVNPGDTAIWWSDLHAPIHDVGALDLVVQCHRLLRPAVSIAGGDMHDVSALSSHRKPAAQTNRFPSLASEAYAVADAFRAIAEASRYAVYIPGNHEGRTERHVDEFPGLEGTLKWHTPYESIHAGWDFLPLGSSVLLADLLCSHGDGLAGSLSKYPAQSVLANHPGQSTIFGHCHKIDVATRPTLRNGRSVVHGAWTCGFLGDARRMDYAASIRGAWQLGFGVINFFERGAGKVGFSVSPIRIYPTVAGPIGGGQGRVCYVPGVGALSWDPANGTSFGRDAGVVVTTNGLVRGY